MQILLRPFCARDHVFFVLFHQNRSLLSGCEGEELGDVLDLFKTEDD